MANHFTFHGIEFSGEYDTRDEFTSTVYTRIWGQHNDFRTAETAEELAGKYWDLVHASDLDDPEGIAWPS